MKTTSYLIVLSLAFFLACSNGKTNENTNKPVVQALPAFLNSADTVQKIIHTVLEVSANDFYKNQQPTPVSFRNLQLKFNIKPSKEVLYLLCGEFCTVNNPVEKDWVHFTTIKNSDYEQWIGANGLGYCENSTEIPTPGTDLTIEMNKRFQSLRTNN